MEAGAERRAVPLRARNVVGRQAQMNPKFGRIPLNVNVTAATNSNTEELAEQRVTRDA